jgi:hypothetical protein
MLPPINRAMPHPDDDDEPQPWPLDEAIAHALRVLRDPAADTWARRFAADQLSFAYESAQDQTP